jgi:hypothetical protein
MALLGGAAGLLGAVALGRLLRGVLYGVPPFDPLVLSVVPLVVLAVAAAATLGPALRAARTDPGTTLRAE